ncbi:MAG: DUF1836 domain-containing protein [Clostridium sulfidigenes]|uniref:DUF1836 domain-containing protein n=1 Tax=Clostridium sulfidigenes TaxID=318464 RepID=A0A927W9H3_9CLOT|nr:DUF1836 domain-containing protein [Clostridium sulfidigenes]
MNDRERDNGNIFQEVVSKFSEMIGENTEKSIIQYDELPQYDLFLSQVKDYLNDKFKHDKFTNSILQNYIKSEVISKPEDGKKRGYTKLHLAQLVLLGYMRPILTTDEIKSVFRLAFNDINNREDDILSWEDTFKLFSDLQQKNIELFFSGEEKDLEEIIRRHLEKYEFNNEDKERILIFLLVMILVAHASNIKKLVTTLVEEFGDKYK